MTINPYESPLAESRTASSVLRRAATPAFWLSATLPVHGGAFLFFGLLICGCHFHLFAALISAIPILLGLVAFFLCRNQVVAYVNGFLVIAWLFIAWQSNLQFLFRSGL
jgi:hypothetical protein